MSLVLKMMCVRRLVKVWPIALTPLPGLAKVVPLYPRASARGPEFGHFWARVYSETSPSPSGRGCPEGAGEGEPLQRKGQFTQAVGQSTGDAAR